MIVDINFSPLRVGALLFKPLKVTKYCIIKKHQNVKLKQFTIVTLNLLSTIILLINFC